MSGLRKWHLLCPNCEYPNEVFHMDWTSLKCSGCGGLVEQNEWKDVWEMEDPDPHPADAVGEKPLPDEHIDNEESDIDMRNKIIRLETVCQMTGLSKASVYKQMKMDQFPKGIKLTQRAAGWDEKAIVAWIDAKLSGATPEEIEKLVWDLAHPGCPLSSPAIIAGVDKDDAAETDERDPRVDEHIDNEIAKESDMSYGELYSKYVKKEIALMVEMLEKKEAASVTYAAKKKPVPFEQELIEVLKDLAIQVNVLPDRLAQAMEYKLAEHHVIAMPGEEEEEENDEQL